MGEIIFGVVFVGAVLVAFLVYQRAQRSAPVVYQVAAEDPELVAAREKAQATLSEFRELHAAHPDGSMVKVPVTSSKGVLEWMVGEVIELADVYVRVQFHTRPATHRGAFQATQVFAVRDIADWMVCTPAGKYRGGFTQRVHFERMRAAGTLVGAAAAEAAKYE